VEESPPAGRVTDETNYSRLADHPSKASGSALLQAVESLSPANQILQIELETAAELE